jgi:hypothetical protein
MIHTVEDKKSTNKLNRGTDDSARNCENTRCSVGFDGGRVCSKTKSILLDHYIDE